MSNEIQPDLDIDYEPVPDPKAPDSVVGGCSTCGHLACVCRIIAAHKPECRFRKAATFAVGIECEHGRDVCPICDPCDCGEKP